MAGAGGRRAALLPAVLACLLVLTGCSMVVVGQAIPALPPVTDAEPGEIEVVGATDQEVDVLARNALADLETFWAEQQPAVFGLPFEPLEGGYFSVDPGDVDPRLYPTGIGCGADPREVEDNAYYCLAREAPNSDAISYDRTFLGDLGADFGRFIPALVMAHEFGHAVQARVGSPEFSILVETQADCLAGAWSRWVADGAAEHTVLRTSELDDVLRGYLLLRDPVGTNPGQPQAHGSYFDRVSAFQEGFELGAEACRDNFDVARPLTQDRFRTVGEIETGGNAPYEVLLDIAAETLPQAWASALGDDFRPPSVERFDGEAPDCAPDPGLDLVYCPDDGLVAFDETDLAVPAYEELGDFAVATAISLPYGLAVRDQLGLSVDDEDAARSVVCLSGWYAEQLYSDPLGADGIFTSSISPGDVDESVQFLLTFGSEPEVLPGVDLTGFQLVDLYRAGFFEGLDACGL
ncbi:neutral zinc metallopeptidase [Blastococcus sp. CCUG 61487]|uniref:neutral zinc metallopeptidase n=1 Tax=Blastococcus sp. CCUG 61487 TaxID=1840703 RepID=UPI0010C04799|nr:neutral zinc metallopeptidase [Blastococcus sp. CCUG 61487]TKJ18639.1 hypothetical protein A6V29_11260 [Blastococcus sp. CCUG 61487]